MEVIEVRPRGYCHGVVSALKKVRDVLADPSYPRPIYILGRVVHNAHVTRALEKQGVIHLYDRNRTQLELIESVPKGTVVFSAHGVSRRVIERARSLGLTTVNAVCKDVDRVHDLIRKRLDDGDQVLYIGHKGHPETEAILSIDPSIVLVESTKDALIRPQRRTGERIFVTNQTTLSLHDIEPILTVIRNRFENVVFDNEICQATTMRQEAITRIEADLLIVVGDPMSSNTNQLAAVGRRQGIRSERIESLDELELAWLEGIDVVAVTSGASTPTRITREVIRFLRAYDKNDPSTWDNRSRLDLDRIV
ncbi:MAG: 4-hydroxy-3-methylbut-2-enyl diphosphate reductase [Acholeplasmataceae bacterium]